MTLAENLQKDLSFLFGPMTTQEEKAKAGAKQPLRRRKYAHATLDRFSSPSLLTGGQDQDEDILRALESLRRQARSEYQNNDYVRRAVFVMRQNVVGPDGPLFRPMCRRRNGDKDQPACEALEGAWRAWGKRGTPEVSGKYSWIDLENLFVSGLVIDGEVLLRLHTQRQSRWGFAVELIDPARLDIQLNKAQGRTRIIMGVEVDRYRRPVAYHILPDQFSSSYARRQTERVPADSILHIFIPEFAVQTRGVPMLASTVYRGRMMRGYEEAELTASRLAAAKVGFFTQSSEGDNYQGDEEGGIIDAAEPGQMIQLPYGVDFTSWDPAHPSKNYASYMESMLRGVAAGVGVPYHDISQDLSKVNFSSLRYSGLSSQDTWKTLQRLLIDALEEPCYRWWLFYALLNEAIEIRPGAPLPLERLEKYRQVQWVGRRWAHVQPREQAAAEDIGIKNGTLTIRAVVEARGEKSFQEHLDELVEERNILRSAGLASSLTGQISSDENEASGFAGGSPDEQSGGSFRESEEGDEAQ